jgi:hypothetical protein
VRAALQDSSHERVTPLATFCADGSALLLGIIYQLDNSTLQVPWVVKIDTEKHNCSISSSPSGWTNNKLGLVWLQQVIKHCTKQKARLVRGWRLLIVDDHGSHLTLEFLEYCEAHRILVSVFLLHSTHTLQPLDVVCFKPLSGAYTHQLAHYLHCSQDLVPLKKEDFFVQFWVAWSSSVRSQAKNAARAASLEVSPAALPKLSSCGCAIMLLQKLRYYGLYACNWQVTTLKISRQSLL